MKVLLLKLELELSKTGEEQGTEDKKREIGHLGLEWDRIIIIKDILSMNL